MTPIDDSLLDALESHALHIKSSKPAPIAPVWLLNRYEEAKVALLNPTTVLSLIAELRRLRKLEADLNHELTDEECQKMYDGLMRDISIHGEEEK